MIGLIKGDARSLNFVSNRPQKDTRMYRGFYCGPRLLVQV